MLWFCGDSAETTRPSESYFSIFPPSAFKSFQFFFVLFFSEGRKVSQLLFHHLSLNTIEETLYLRIKTNRLVIIEILPLLTLKTRVCASAEYHQLTV